MPRVLIIDTEGNQRRSLVLGLRLSGFHVATASSAAEAFSALDADLPFDLVMIDLMIPELPGLDLARQVRERFREVRIVLSSAYPLSARQLERTECGAVGFVPKPYDVEAVARFLRAKTSTLAA
jgi:DNA-binding response OmpR family regulator